jgi:ribonucleoside-diphosphate reductase alpha chain
MYCDEKTGLPQETFLNVGSGGGCERNYQFISRLMSLALRAGVSLNDIIDQAMSIRPCTSYINRTKSKGDTSTGTSCPSAIGNALKDLKNKISKVHDTEEEKKELNNVVEQSKKEQTVNNIVKKAVSSGAKCPECGEDIVFEGGCNVCKYCGWSKCS